MIYFDGGLIISNKKDGKEKRPEKVLIIKERHKFDPFCPGADSPGWGAE